MPICRRDGCGYKGDADTFKGGGSVYHDLYCPKCGTSNLDTSDINAQWKAEGKVYGYGDHNVLDMSNVNKTKNP